MTKSSTLLALLALAASTNALDISIQQEEIKLLWSTWKSINNKVYAEAEEGHRFFVFVENYIDVVTRNKQNTGAKFALNQFADLTDEEFASQYLGFNHDDSEVDANESTIDYSILAVPDSVDWREKGAVTPVKNQAKCGSCWAFSTVGALEGFNFIKTGKLEAFSEQQLVDCDRQENGCGGGWMHRAMTYAAKNGIELEADYPYTAKGETCKFNKTKAHQVNKGTKRVATKNADALKAAIAVQPVSVALAGIPLKSYKSGVLKADCNGQINHGVLAVGYTTHEGEETFIIKNSWTDAWGEKGYGYISTDKKANHGDGACRILNYGGAFPTA